MRESVSVCERERESVCDGHILSKDIEQDILIYSIKIHPQNTQKRPVVTKKSPGNIQKSPLVWYTLTRATNTNRQMPDGIT